MKMVKRLLLGTAAGCVVVAGAQAADMPVKAKPVQYVKICTLYGDGYYYIPGSDTCIKVGGYVRADYGYNVQGGRVPAYSGTQGAQDRTVASYSSRQRANVQMDTRTQTQYGTLRTLTSLHFQNQDNVFSFNVARALIQWAGFTFGRADSFTSIWTISDGSWHYAQQQNDSETPDGVNQIAYTFEVGNGVTLTFGADERRTKAIANLSSNAALKVGAEPVSSNAGENWPDPFVMFRVEQVWGYWGAGFVAHDARATYYTAPTAIGAACGGAGVQTTAQVALTSCGHPGDKIGWAVLTGGEIKLPFITQGDRAGYFAHYGQGAAGYSGGSNLASPGLFGAGNQVAVGWITDGVFVNGAGIELTTAWSVGAGYEHFWTPQLKTSFTGAYTRISYDSTAKTYFASNVCGGTGTTGQSGINTVTNCNPDWSFFQGGVRTQWSPVPGLLFGVEGLYTQVWTAFNGSVATLGPQPVSGARPQGTYSINNQGIWSAIFRAQRNFNAD
jgi:hypothetical protein